MFVIPFSDNSDLIACMVVSKDGGQAQRFLAVDVYQMSLVEPESKRLGWGVVKFAGLLQVRKKKCTRLLFCFFQLKLNVDWKPWIFFCNIVLITYSLLFILIYLFFVLQCNSALLFSSTGCFVLLSCCVLITQAFSLYTQFIVSFLQETCKALSDALRVCAVAVHLFQWKCKFCSAYYCQQVTLQQPKWKTCIRFLSSENNHNSN